MKSTPRWPAGMMVLALVLGATLTLGARALPVAAGPSDGEELPQPVFLPLVLGAGTPQPPLIEYFRAVPETITSGQCSLLEWGAVTGASSAAVEPGVGAVATPGSQTVCPAATTDFTLSAAGPGGVSTATVTVTVEGGGPPPSEEWDPRLDDLGVRLEPAVVGEAEPYWKLVKARWADPDEAAGLHHIFLDVLDASGQRVVGQVVTIHWPDGSVDVPIEDKPPPEWGANYPMFATLGNYDAEVGASEPSDRVTGMGMGTIEFPDVKYHTCFYLTFQWVPASVDETSLEH